MEILDTLGTFRDWADEETITFVEERGDVSACGETQHHTQPAQRSGDKVLEAAASWTILLR